MVQQFHNLKDRIKEGSAINLTLKIVLGYALLTMIL